MRALCGDAEVTPKLELEVPKKETMYEGLYVFDRLKLRAGQRPHAPRAGATRLRYAPTTAPLSPVLHGGSTQGRFQHAAGLKGRTALRRV
jgi:hypothetical protein